MAYNVALWGAVSSLIQPYADGQGQVPEPGDAWQTFDWDHRLVKRFSDPVSGAKDWQAFVADAARMAKQAGEVLTLLEDSNSF